MINVELEELKRERRETIIKLYYKFLKECPRTNKRSVEYAVNKIIECEAPKYYVTYDRARRVISDMLKRDVLDIQLDNKSAMYKELYDKIIKFIFVRVNYLNKAFLAFPVVEFYGIMGASQTKQEI